MCLLVSCGHIASATQPFWKQTLPNSMFSSVGIIGSATSSDDNISGIKFAAATWMNGPELVEVFSSESKNGTVNWVYQQHDISESTLAVAAARHIDLPSSGPVDLVVAKQYQAQGFGACVLLGFSSKNSTANPRWKYNIVGNCSVDLTLEGDSKPTLKLSDDGSTVVFAVVTFDARTETNTPQLHCVDGQSGGSIFVFQPENTSVGTNSVSLSRGGKYIAYSNGLTVYVLERSGQLRSTPLLRQMESDVHICPMGVFLLYAVNDGSVVRSWNASSKEYQITPFQPKTPAGTPNTWIAVSHATSVNGEGSNPTGCIAAVGWLGMGPNQGIAKLEVFSMLTGQVFVSWTSKRGNGLENFPVMAMHFGYTALGLWGNTARSIQPNILLFHINSGNTPVIEYSSTGSIMAIDLVYTPYALPPLKGPGQLTKNNQAKVFVIAAGKIEHATMVGKGGRCLAFSVPVAEGAPPTVAASGVDLFKGLPLKS